jgi:hypothetical protein
LTKLRGVSGANRIAFEIDIFRNRDVQPIKQDPSLDLGF